MTVWVLHQELSPEEGARITQREYLTLPFGDLPDLSGISSPQQFRKLLKTLYPDDPPETISGRIERVWSRYANLHAEDLIAAPLRGARVMALAEVTGRYRYKDGAHVIPVKWHEKRVPARALRKHIYLFDEGANPLREVDNPEARTILRSYLPHSYNRFSGWKWIIGAFFVMGMIMRVLHFVTRH